MAFLLYFAILKINAIKMLLGCPVCSYSGELQQGNPNLWAGRQLYLKRWLWTKFCWISIKTCWDLKIRFNNISSAGGSFRSGVELAEVQCKGAFLQVTHLIFLTLETPFFQGLPLSPVHRCIECSACCCQVRYLTLKSASFTTSATNKRSWK